MDAPTPLHLQPIVCAHCGLAGHPKAECPDLHPAAVEASRDEVA